MQSKLLLLPVMAGLVVSLSSCFDDNYDLSDIDTTTRISVTDLVVPVNIDEVTLSDIIVPDEGSKIQAVTINGQDFYALSEKGSFSSKPIEIKKVTAPAPKINSTKSTLSRIDFFGAPGMMRAPLGAVTYHLEGISTSFDYNGTNIDKSIVDIYSAKVEPILFKVEYKVTGLESLIDRMYFTDFSLYAPLGLTATPSIGDYDPASGIWNIGSADIVDGTISITIETIGVDFRQAGCYITPEHTFSYAGQFNVIGGDLTIVPKIINGIPAELPDKIEVVSNYTCSDLVVNEFSGRINYQLSGMNINPVYLTNLPDFLGGNETNIDLANPQIYLQVNNPVAGDNLDCSTGLTLSAIRQGEPTVDFTPDVNTITVRHDLGVAGPYNFALSPDQSKLSVPDAFSSPEFIQFSSLGQLLAGEGLPDRIGITLNDPQIPEQDVFDFALGRSLEGVKGQYELLAPLALNAGSQIVYSDRVDGWSSDDLDAVVVEALTISANITNNTPLSAYLTVYPLDKNGNRMSGVEIQSTQIPANTEGMPFEIRLTGEVRLLDGVELEARVVADESTNPLSPSQTIKLDHIRARVSGYYEKEL